MNNTNNQKKITFVISSLAGGGAEKVCVNIANGLASQGWNVTLMVLNLKNSVFHTNVNKNVNFVVLDVNNARYAFLPIYKYIKANRLTKIVAFNYDMAVIFILIRMFSSLNYSILARNINSLTEKLGHVPKGIRSRISMWLVSKLYSKADHVVNQCHSMEDDLLQVLPQLSGKTSVIYNAVNLSIEEFAENYERTSVKKENYLLCIGRLEEQKAFHVAIEAFAKLTDMFPLLRLKIVGEGSLKAELISLATTLGVINKVDFEGFIENTAPYYLHAKATLLTSLYEGFPNVLVESVTLGTPVVSFDCLSGPSEIVVPMQNGFLIENKNVSALVTGIIEVLQDDGKLSRQAVISTSDTFANIIIISKWAALLKNHKMICDT